MTASAEVLRRLVDHVPSMMAYWDDRLCCQFANRAYAVWFGVDPDALVGRHISELLGPELYAKNEPFMRAALRGEPQIFERAIPGPDGVVRHSIAYYTPDLDGDRVRGFVAYVTEVTRLKQAEAKLEAVIAELKVEVQRRKSAEETIVEVEQSLSVSLDSVGAGFVTTDAAGNVSRMNEVAEKMTGLAESEARGRSFWDVVVRENRPPELVAKSPIDVMLELGTTLEMRHHFVVVGHDGRRTAVEGQATLQRDERGAVRGIAMFLRDVTRLDAAERASRRLAAVVEGSNDAIVAKTLEGRITDWNAGAERLFGYTAAEAIGQPIEMLLPPERRHEEAEIMASVRQGVAVAPFDTVRVTKEGRSVEVSVGISPIRDGLGVVVGASKIARDISEAKRLEAELRRSNLELEQFAYVASHDLQEPLRMVVNYAELLEQRYKGQLDERADKYIHYATDGARRMQRLVTDLLAYSRVGSQGKPLVPVSSDEIVKQVLASLGRSIRDAGAVVDVAPLPDVVGDEGQLRQLFQNLVSNAIKFRGDQAPRVEIRARDLDGRTCFSVKDNGIGLEMRFAERIFQMFQRLHEVGQYPGSGIGLAIAKRIVERHGGTLWVESRPGEGATFSFTLARADAPIPETTPR